MPRLRFDFDTSKMHRLRQFYTTLENEETKEEDDKK